jgi:hypothetical protein
MSYNIHRRSSCASREIASSRVMVGIKLSPVTSAESANDPKTMQDYDGSKSS